MGLRCHGPARTRFSDLANVREAAQHRGMRRLPPDDVFRRLVVIRDTLRGNPAEAPRMDELARRAGLSRFHFQRRYKEAFGRTPLEDITLLRIERAKALLAGDASITDVCLEVGYSSLGSFSTLFAERAGCPPSAWRRRYVQVVKAMPEPAIFAIPWCFAIRNAEAS